MEIYAYLEVFIQGCKVETVEDHREQDHCIGVVTCAAYWGEDCLDFISVFRPKLEFENGSDDAFVEWDDWHVDGEEENGGWEVDEAIDKIIEICLHSQ